MDLTRQPWYNKISNAFQLGGIETSVLDNGAGRGTRIAWINTGGGFRFKVVIDRAMDIADAFYNQHSLAWLSHVGITSPQPFSNHGMDWIHTFGGGLLTTCGLSHVGGPEADEYGERGLHGGVSNLPAEIESIIQPDPASWQDGYEHYGNDQTNKSIRSQSGITTYDFSNAWEARLEHPRRSCQRGQYARASHAVISFQFWMASGR